MRLCWYLVRTVRKRGLKMILELNERQKITIENLEEIRRICNGILRRFEKGSTMFLVEDIKDIKNYTEFIAEDCFNVDLSE